MALAPTTDPGPVDAYAARILDAALEQFELFGLRRSTVDDVARRAGVARVTVYRRFPGRDQLLAAVVAREGARLFARLDTAVAAEHGPTGKLVEGFVTTLRFAREHPLLQRLLATEPELILPLLTRDGEVIIALARSYLAGHISAAQDAGDLPQGIDPAGVAELFVRLVHSLVLTPGGVLGPSDDDDARRIAQHYLVPALALARTDRPSRSTP